MKNINRLTALSLFGAAIATFAIDPQTADYGTLSSFTRANRVLNATVEAMGGQQALRAIASTSLQYEADTRLRNQSAGPNGPWAEQTGRGQIAWEEGGSYRARVEANFRGGARFETTQLLVNGKGYLRNEITGQWTPMSATEISIVESGTTSNVSRAVPTSLLQSALSNRSSLRWLGERRHTNSDVLGFALGDGTIVTMTIDRSTHLPQLWESVVGDPVLGDVTSSVSYDDYQVVDGVTFPHTISFKLGGETLTTWTLAEVSLNHDLDPDLFLPPADSLLGTYEPAFSPVQVGEHLYAMRLFSGFSNSYNILLAEFEDHVMVVEAPLTDILARFVTGVAQSLFGDKPIRYVVSTHYHADHLGGFRGYVANGATLVTGRNTATQARRMVANQSILQPNPLQGADPSIQVVENELTVDEGLQARIMQVGPTPHVDDLLLIYFPESKVLYTGDHFSRREDGSYGPANESLIWLANKLEELELEVNLFVPTHGAPTPIEDFRRTIAEE